MSRHLWFDINGLPIDVATANELLKDVDARRIARTVVGQFTVSTVHIVLDHSMTLDGSGPPLIFETMVFDADEKALDDICVRCATKEGALAAHDQVVAEMRDRVG